MSSNSKFRIGCPKCNAALSIPTRKAGQSVVCPACKRPFTAPTIASLEGAKADQAEAEPSDQLSLDDLDPSLFDNVDQLIEDHKTSEAEKVQSAADKPSELEATKSNNAVESAPEAEVQSTDPPDEKPGLTVKDYEDEFSLDEHLDSPALQLGSGSATPGVSEEPALEFPDSVHEAKEPAVAESNAALLSQPEFAEMEEEEDVSEQPLSLDGIGAPKSSDIYAVVCKICDSRIQVTLRDEGKTVDCPECFTELHVHGPSKEERARMEKAREAEYQLAPAEPLPRPIADGHGLEMETRDLLAPPSQDLFGSEDEPPSEPWKEAEAKEETQFNSNSRKKKSAPNSKKSSSSSTEKNGTDPKPEKKNGKTKHKYGSKGYWEAKVSEAEQDNQLPEILAKEEAKAADYLGWAIKSFRSTDLIARSAIGCITLGFAYWMSDIFSHSFGNPSLSYSDQVLGVFFPIILGAGALVISLLLLITTVSLVFQNSIGGVSHKEEWPGFTISEYTTPVLFFVFSFWLAAIPGGLMGLLLALATGLNIWVLVLGSFSAFLFSPPLYMSACFNRSPIQIYAKKVMESFGTQDVGWLHYVPLAFGAWIIFAAGVATVHVPFFLFAFIGASLQILGLLVFSIWIGLFCGRYLTHLR